MFFFSVYNNVSWINWKVSEFVQTRLPHGPSSTMFGNFGGFCFNITFLDTVGMIEKYNINFYPTCDILPEIRILVQNLNNTFLPYRGCYFWKLYDIFLSFDPIKIFKFWPFPLTTPIDHPMSLDIDSFLNLYVLI